MGDDWEERIFLQNPLHDVSESVWWIAIWFVFYSRPEEAADNVMEEARGKVYEDRSLLFLVAGAFRRACKLLPKVFEPLGEIPVKMNSLLADAYRSFERSFDCSKMLDIFPHLRRYLQLLVKRAPPVSSEHLTQRR